MTDPLARAREIMAERMTREEIDKAPNDNRQIWMNQAMQNYRTRDYKRDCVDLCYLEGMRANRHNDLWVVVVLLLVLVMVA